MNSSRKAVMKKKMQFMMPNAKLAFCIAQYLFVFRSRPFEPLTPFVPTETYAGPLSFKVVQLALAIPRNSYTPAMKAPTKQRSMNETKRAERLVELRRNQVAIAQAQARTETMKRVLREMNVRYAWRLKEASWRN